MMRRAFGLNISLPNCKWVLRLQLSPSHPVEGFGGRESAKLAKAIIAGEAMISASLDVDGGQIGAAEQLLGHLRCDPLWPFERRIHESSYDWIDPTLKISK
jgi:hypothetical protein